MMSVESNREIEESLIFLGIDAHPDECDFCEDGSVYYGLTEVLPKGSVYEDDEDTPTEGDFTITPCGPLGGRSGLGRIGGRFVGEFDSDEDAKDAANQIMYDESYWPNVWMVSDHGNVTLLTE
jgi:hypothetical protein